MDKGGGKGQGQYLYQVVLYCCGSVLSSLTSTDGWGEKVMVRLNHIRLEKGGRSNFHVSNFHVSYL